MPSPFIIVRYVTLGIATLLAIVELVISARLTLFLSDPISGFYGPGVLGIVVAGFTVITVLPLLLTSSLCKGAVPSLIFFECALISFLWLGWLAAAIYFTVLDSGLPPNCNNIFDITGWVFNCREFVARNVFMWLNTVILFGYSMLLLIMSIIQQDRGNPIWAKPVTEADLFAPRAAAPAVTMEQGTFGNPPQQQHLIYAPQPLQQQPLQMAYATPPPQQIVYAPAIPTASTSAPQQIVYAPAPPTVTTPPPQQIVYAIPTASTSTPQQIVYAPAAPPQQIPPSVDQPQV